MVYFQTWGIWKSGYKKIDLIIMSLTEGNTKHTIKGRRFLRITLGAHSLPNHGQHPANNCSWQNLSITQRDPNLILAFGEINQLWLFQFHSQQYFRMCRDKDLPNAWSTKNCGNKALYVCIVAFLKFGQGWDLPGCSSCYSPQTEFKPPG